MRILLYQCAEEKRNETIELLKYTLKQYKVEIDCFDCIDFHKINTRKYDLAFIYMEEDYLSLVRYLQYHDCIILLMSQNLNDVAIALYLDAYAFIYKRYYFYETILKAVKHYKEKQLCLIIETERKIEPILLKNIIYIELCDGEHYIMTTKCMYYGKIKDFNLIKNKLALYKIIQIHRHYLVNIDYIRGYKEKEVVTKYNHHIPRSLKYKFNLLQFK